MLVALSEITTFVIELYADENTDDIPPEHTHCGIVTSLIPPQPEKAEVAILVTLSGIITLARLTQPRNVSSLMHRTPFGIVMRFML